MGMFDDVLEKMESQRKEAEEAYRRRAVYLCRCALVAVMMIVLISVAAWVTWGFASAVIAFCSCVFYYCVRLLTP